MLEYLGRVYKGRRVLVTGHTGFKGTWMIMLLRRLGAKVHGFALDPPTTPSLYHEVKLSDLIGDHRGDIRDFMRVSRVVQNVEPEIVIHMAAQSLVRPSFEQPVDTFSTNVMGTVNLLEACRKVGSIRALVNVTTDKCYDNKEWLWGYRESEALGGYDPYSSSKACAELVTGAYRNSFFNVREYAAHGLALASARAGNVIGGGDFARDRLVPDFIRAISQGKMVRIRNPLAIRPWQHVLEPISGYLLLAAKLLEEGPSFAEAWNFGPHDQDAKNVNWMAGKLCELWGEGASYVTDEEAHPHEATYLKLDCSKVRARLNWQPRWCVEVSLRWIVDWHREWMRGVSAAGLSEIRIENYFATNKVVV